MPVNTSLVSESHLPPFELLNLLSDGQLHSGQELANLLGVSRTAIWKQLSKLEPLGLDLESVPGSGYRLIDGLELLSRERIIEKQSSICLAQISELLILKTIDSTNAYLLKRSLLEKITICLAEHQTSGRGRRGRGWVSPFAKNIYLSFGLAFQSGLSGLEGVSLAIGVAIAKVLSAAGVQDVKLKWPNDVLWRNRKLAGVLIEVVGDPSGACHLVAGIGLNVLGDKGMAASISQPWTSLREISEEICVPLEKRNDIAAALIAEVVPLLAEYEQVGFASYREDWENLNAHTGLAIDIIMGATVMSGTFVGIDPMGALILRTENGDALIHGGEVSLREVAK